MQALTSHFAAKVFQSHQQARNLKAETISYNLALLKRFFNFMRAQNGTQVDLRNVGLKELQAYACYLSQTLTQRTKQPLSDKYKACCLANVQRLFKYLYIHEYLLTNPLADFCYKQRQESGKRAILSAKELSRVLNGIELSAPAGLRDRTLFELMYGTGLRVDEVRRLRLCDIDFEARLVFVHGKGGKPRLQPVSEAAFLFLKNYIGAREHHSLEPIFKGQGQGGFLAKNAINCNFKKWVRKAGIKRKGVSTHSIRHSIATHLLENGANVRYVQAFLGHQSLKTTTLYTHMLYKNLKRIYKSLHPRENEYYQEVDAAYRARITAFKKRLVERKADTERKRVANERAYQQKRHKR